MTWPLIRPGLANAFLIAFIESIADFGNPLVIGGNFRVLSTEHLSSPSSAPRTTRAARRSLGARAARLHARPPSCCSAAGLGERSYVDRLRQGRWRRAGRAAAAARRRLCYAASLPWMALTAAIYGIIIDRRLRREPRRATTASPSSICITAFAVAQGEHGWFLARLRVELADHDAGHRGAVDDR